VPTEQRLENVKPELAVTRPSPPAPRPSPPAPRPPTPPAPWSAAWLAPWLLLGTCMVLVPCVLRQQGRAWWCACGRPALWEGSVWSSHCSQHFLDPYSFSHLLHGVMFFLAFAWVAPRLPLIGRFALAVCLESGWEVLENTRFIIERYREGTMALGYEGDSILNSLGDIGCCALGFLVAGRLGTRWSLLLILGVELAMLLWIRDNLTLNVIMLICPNDAIRQWQMVH